MNNSGKTGAATVRRKKFASGGCVLGAALSTLLVATPCRAQTAESQAAAGLMLLSTTIGVPATAVGIGVFFSVRGSSKGSAGDVAEAYLRKHSTQLALDIRRGSGGTVKDLATAAGVPATRLEQFAVALRSHASDLLPLAKEETLDSARALRFMEKIDEIAKSVG